LKSLVDQSTKRAFPDPVVAEELIHLAASLGTDIFAAATGWQITDLNTLKAVVQSVGTDEAQSECTVKIVRPTRKMTAVSFHDLGPKGPNSGTLGTRYAMSVAPGLARL
jgi:hypothetical protein